MIQRVYLPRLGSIVTKDKITFFEYLHLNVNVYLMQYAILVKLPTWIQYPAVPKQSQILRPLNTLCFPSILPLFNAKTELLIVKMVTPEHSQIGSAVNKAIDNALRRMGLDLAINHYHAVDIDVNGRMKQSDMAWGPTRTPRGRHKRPTVVLEVAVSETKSKLHRDMDLWLDPGRGNANVAIGIKANRKRPMISIEKWVWDDVNGRALQSQYIEVSENELDEVKLSGGPFIIPFHHLFLRDPELPRRDGICNSINLVHLSRSFLLLS